MLDSIQFVLFVLKENAHRLWKALKGCLRTGCMRLWTGSSKYTLPKVLHMDFVACPQGRASALLKRTNPARMLAGFVIRLSRIFLWKLAWPFWLRAFPSVIFQPPSWASSSEHFFLWPCQRVCFVRGFVQRNPDSDRL